MDTIRESVLAGVNGDELTALLSDLVKIPSHSMYGPREKEISAYLLSFFEKNGIETELIEVKDGRPNVMAYLRGSGGGKTLMLNGHVDTVPAFGMDDPFGADIRDGLMYGRGTADMKSGVAAMAYTLVLLKRAGVRLKADLIFAGVIDEDAAGSAGSRYIVENGPLTDFAIVGEPTGLKPVVAHKGHDYFTAVFKGKAMHSSTPEKGENAIFAAARFINLIESELQPEYDKILHPYVSRPSVNPGLIMGSALANRPFLLGQTPTFAGIVADDCSVYIDVRWSPRQTLEEVKNDLDELCKRAVEGRPLLSYDLSYIPLPRPAMEIDPDNVLVRTMQKNVEAVTGSFYEPGGANFWADSGVLHGISGVPCVILGPGDIGCAHADVEYVSLDETADAARVYALTAMDICGRE